MGPPVVRSSSIRSMPMTFWIPDEISVSNSGWKAETTPPIRACRHCSPARITAIFPASRSEEHTSELQSLMRISYAVFCLKKKITTELYKLHHNQLTIRTTFTHNHH